MTTKKYEETRPMIFKNGCKSSRTIWQMKSVSEHRDASSFSHELPSEPRATVVSGKHSVQWSRGESGKETSLVADIEELEKMDASEIHAKRLNAKEVLTPMNGDKFIFPIADGTVKLSGGDQVLKASTLLRDRPDQGEEERNLQEESDGFSSTPPQDSLPDASEARNDFWSMSGNFIYRHHVEP